MIVAIASGKGGTGTGKASLTALFAQLAERPVIAEEGKPPLILVDGPPGIGCPVIASATGATDVLLVTEPTLSVGDNACDH